MLYGHVENYSHRIDHMERLRQLQDETKGFNTFIPLKFRNKNNDMSDVPESTVIEDLRNYAVSRIYLDNFEHISSAGRTPVESDTLYKTYNDFGSESLGINKKAEPTFG